MNVRKVKRICGMRGCRNTDSYAVSLTREGGNSIIICKECSKKVYEALKDEPDALPKQVVKAEPAPLFYHPEVDMAAEPEVGEKADEKVDNADEVVDGEASEKEPDEETNPENTAYICRYCGKGFTTERGLKQHMKTCKAKTE